MQAAAPPLGHPARLAAALAAVIGLAVILGALAFEHLGGYAPCPLCLEQRWPYYLGVPLAALLALAGGRLPRAVLLLGLVLLAGLFAWGLSLAVYQAGAEWRFWQGPTDCAAGNAASDPGGVGGLIDAIEGSTVVSCTDPSLRILGLSLAGWNAVAMAGLLLLVLWGAARALRSR